MGTGTRRIRFGKKGNPGLNLIPCANLYLSDERMDVEAVFHRIRMGRLCPWLYLITLSEQEGELFAIYAASELSQPFYDGRDMYVCGIGRGYRRTLGLVEQMLWQIYQDTDAFDVHRYFHP